MGGHLGATTSPGQGSTFWFTAVLARKQLDKAPAREIAASLKDARILIVDHSTMVRKACKTMIDSWHCRTDEAKDSTTAMEMLNQAAEQGDPYNVALIDLNLPDVSGEELAEMIRADSRLGSTQMVLLTTLIHRGEATRLKMKGFTASITKPMRRKQLYDTLVGIKRYVDTAKGYAMAEYDAFFKVVVENGTGRILGAHAIGPQAADLVQQVVYVMHADEGTYLPLARAQTIHPALSEVVVGALGNLQPAGAPTHHHHHH